ncbi:unnamed protein product, partial [Adineta steineri]
MGEGENAPTMKKRYYYDKWGWKHEEEEKHWRPEET